MLYEMHFPVEASLKVTRLSNDIKTDGKDWQSNIEKAKSLEMQMQQETQTDTEKIEVDENN